MRKQPRAHENDADGAVVNEAAVDEAIPDDDEMSDNNDTGDIVPSANAAALKVKRKKASDDQEESGRSKEPKRGHARSAGDADL